MTSPVGLFHAQVSEPNAGYVLPFVMQSSSSKGLLLVNKQATPLTFNISGVTGGSASCLDGSGLSTTPGMAPPIERRITAEGSLTLGAFGVAVATVVLRTQ